VTCPLCGSRRTRPGRRYRSPFVDAFYTLHACRTCGSASFDPLEGPADLRRIYEAWAEATTSGYAAPHPDSPYWRSQVQTLRRLSARRVRSVLDVGCRTGDFLLHWREGEERVGVELADTAAEIAERRGLHVVRGFVERARFDHRFDVVSCYAVVEHLREPQHFLRSLPRLLEPGGVLVVMVPTRECLKRLLLDALHLRWHMYSPPQHLSFPSRARLDGILAEEGLALVRRTYTSGGLFNPLRRLPRANAAFDRLMMRLDHASALSRLPLFDHMYSFYRAA
jgi:SAM-dependent methyltransferase